LVILERAIQVPGALYKYDSIADKYILVEKQVNLLIDQVEMSEEEKKEESKSKLTRKWVLHVTDSAQKIEYNSCEITASRSISISKDLGEMDWIGDPHPKNPSMLTAWNFVCEQKSDMVPLQGVIIKVKFEVTQIEQNLLEGKSPTKIPEIDEEDQAFFAEYVGDAQ
jgi:hypothetical protein